MLRFYFVSNSPFSNHAEYTRMHAHRVKMLVLGICVQYLIFTNWCSSFPQTFDLLCPFAKKHFFFLYLKLFSYSCPSYFPIAQPCPVLLVPYSYQHSPLLNLRQPLSESWAVHVISFYVSEQYVILLCTIIT